MQAILALEDGRIFRGKGFGARLIDAQDNDRRSGAGEGARRGFTNAARPPGDQGDSVVEAKGRFHSTYYSFSPGKYEFRERTFPYFVCIIWAAPRGGII